MKVIPAIDLLNGKCVCLRRGKKSTKKTYFEDPVAVARKWEDQGAEVLHIVNLESAFSGRLKNLQTLKRLMNAVSISIQVGGGIRSEKNVATLFDLGAAKVILGTILVSNEKVAENIIAKHQNKIIGAIDSLPNGMVAIKGWQYQTSINCFQLAIKLEKLGIGGLIFTDISRDGMLSSPNFELISKFTSSINLPVFAAGGIGTLHDIKRLKKTGAEGIIVGKALYEKKFSFREALEAAKDEFS